MLLLKTFCSSKSFIDVCPVDQTLLDCKVGFYNSLSLDIAINFNSLIIVLAAQDAVYKLSHHNFL